MLGNFFKKGQKENFPLNPKQINQNTLIVGLAQSNKTEALFQEIKEKVNYHLENNEDFDLVFIDFLRVEFSLYIKLYSEFLGDKVKNITSEEDLKTYLNITKDKIQILIFFTDYLMTFEDKEFENEFISKISTNDYDLLAISSKLGVEKHFEKLESLFSRKIILSFFEKKISAWKFIKTNESIYINALRTPGYGIEIVNNLMLADFYKIDFIPYEKKKEEVNNLFLKRWGGIKIVSRNIFKENDLFYYGQRKIFKGKVNKDSFFSIPGNIVNTYGYFFEKNQYFIFVTDDERGIIIRRKSFLSEEDAINYLSELLEAHNFSHLSNQIIENFKNKKDIIINYLKNIYNYSDKRIEKTLKDISSNKIIAFELIYFIENNDFVPDKYALQFYGYTAKKLFEETDLTIIGAFNYLNYLKKNPNEAIFNLNKGLPRKVVFSVEEIPTDS